MLERCGDDNVGLIILAADFHDHVVLVVANVDYVNVAVAVVAGQLFGRFLAEAVSCRQNLIIDCTRKVSSLLPVAFATS